MLLKKKFFVFSAVISVLLAIILFITSYVLTNIVMKALDSGIPLSLYQKILVKIGFIISYYLLLLGTLLPEALRNSVLGTFAGYISAFLMIWIPIVFVAYMRIIRKKP